MSIYTYKLNIIIVLQWSIRLDPHRLSMISEFPWLTAIIAFPLIAALAIPVLPDPDGKNVRLYALGVGILELGAGTNL